MPTRDIITYEPKYKEQIVALYARSFDLDPGFSRRYLEWKYESNPYIDRPLLFLARDSRDAIVGMRGFYGTCWRLRGRSVIVPCADDFVIAAGERDTGLATAIMQFSLESLAHGGFSHVINASGGVTTVLHSLAMGWRSLGQMEPVVRRGHVERTRHAVYTALSKRRFVGRVIRRIASGRSSFSKSFTSKRRTTPARTTVVVAAKTCPEAIANLTGPPDQGCVSHARDEAFVRWRFSNPDREYRFLYCERGGALSGYLAIARHRRHATPLFQIVDWEASSDQARAQLLEDALKWGRFPSIGTWAASFPGDRDLLRRAGFVPHEPELRARGLPCVLLKTIGAVTDASSGLDSATWTIRPIDSMRW